jgi:micrococcal nuclease
MTARRTGSGWKLLTGALAGLFVVALARGGGDHQDTVDLAGDGATPSASATPAASTTARKAQAPSSPRPAAAASKPANATKPQTAKPATSKAPTAAGVLVAVAGIVDGDTIKVRLNGTTERVRVIGIDTPELASRDCYAQQASSKMQSLVQSKQVRLVADPTQADRDRYGRLLRHVRLTDGRSVAQLLIAGGYGEEYTYSRAYAGQAAYRQAEATARAKGLGIWSSGCRAAQTAPAPAPRPAPKPATTPAPSGSCDIKGNIASDGEKIYHLPGQQYYGVTKISESKGERWFCSESEAVAAGWRKSER